MLLICHLLVGAAVAVKIQTAPLALILAFLSHYLLDFVPHWEYSIDNILESRWRKTKYEFLKVALDFCLGLLLVFIFAKGQPIIFASAFLAVLPDGLTLVGLILPNKLLNLHDAFHRKIVHYFKKEQFRKNKILVFLGMLSQILISILAILLL